MIAFILLLLAAQGVAAAPAPPADWSALPPLRYRHTPELPPAADAFAQGEVAAGRCTAPHGRPLHVEIAVLVGPGGAERVVPRAIGCATVEQFASGLVTRFTRDNVDPEDAPGWRVTSVDLGLVE